jgi:hypothetical protein
MLIFSNNGSDGAFFQFKKDISTQTWIDPDKKIYMLDWIGSFPDVGS